MKKTKDREIKLIFAAVILLFGAFLVLPVFRLLGKSFLGDSGVTTAFYREVFGSKGFLTALGNSFLVASLAALCTTAIAFLLAYTIHYTNVPKKLKKFLRAAAVLPMLLPTITYGFAILYSFGKEGLLTKIFGKQLFQIYGMNGLLLGYVIYTLPVSFMLLYNAMSYIDKKYMVVSRVMGDNALSTFWITIIRPLLGTLAASFVQSFFLSFTDFGIPAAVGGEFEVLAGVLYDRMLGSVPNFHNGAVVAVVMLIPSVVSIALLHYLEKYNVRYNKISNIEIRKNRGRDIVCAGLGSFICLGVLMIFLVIFVVPFVKQWPYELGFTLENVKNVFGDSELLNVYLNSLYTAFFTAVFGTLTAYGSALVTARSKLSRALKNVIEGIALVTNTIPGMVLGLAFLFAFSGTGLQSTFAILVLCNVIHFFSTPYLMMKESLAKMNASWETTAMLMGDNWLKTIVRIVTPNALSTKLRRSHIFWILLAPVILLWIPSFLNADINFEATGISPENNFFIQSYLGFTWFMFPASLVVCTVLLTQSERTNKGLQKMLSLPVNPQLFCLAKFTILLLLAAFQLLLMGAAYFPTAMIVSHMQNYSMVLPVSLVLKESCLLYLSAIPMAALYWMLAVCIHTPVFSIGAGLASIVPSMLLINTKVWFAYPVSYPIYTLMILRGTMENSFRSFVMDPIPWIPVSIGMTLVFLAVSCITFGRYERR